jgi:hypothetical protein
MTKYVPREHLWTEWGGDLQFEYDHAEYWPALVALCAQRRADRLARWERGGKQVGELEDYLTGKVDVGVAGSGPRNVIPETGKQEMDAQNVISETGVDGLMMDALQIEEVNEKTAEVEQVPAVASAAT